MVSVTKLYLQVLIKYLYDDMIKQPNLGGLDESKDSDRNEIISDYKRRKLLPTQVQLM